MADSSFEHHVATAKKNGITAREMAAILTHVAFYAGWPNAWAAFRVVLGGVRRRPLDLENPRPTAASSAWATPTTPPRSTSRASPT